MDPTKPEPTVADALTALVSAFPTEADVSAKLDTMLNLPADAVVQPGDIDRVEASLELEQSLDDARHHLGVFLKLKDDADAKRKALKEKHALMAKDYQAEMDAHQVTKAKLALVHSPLDDVWIWDPKDPPPAGLTCAVVMTADTWRELLGRLGIAVTR